MAGAVQFTLGEQDYIEANRDYARRFLARPRNIMRTALLVAGTMAAGALLAQGLSDPREPGSLAIGFGAAALGGILLCQLLGYLLIPRRARRLYRQQASLQKPYRYTWSDAGFAYASETDNAAVAWPELHRWSPGRRTILFFLNDQLFYAIPRHVLTEAQASDLTTLAERHGPPRF